MNRKLFRTCILAGAIGSLASCRDDTTAPRTAAEPSAGPSFAAGVPFNDTGACLATDAFLSGATSGVNSETSLADPTKSCTSNDVRVASADVVEFSYDGVAYTKYTGQTVTCNIGDPIFVKVAANLEETATSARSDIGIWVGLKGSNGRTGTCNHYNLVSPTPKGTVLGGVSNIDGDLCGDMNAGAKTSPAVPLGIIEAKCESSGPTSQLLHIGSCLGWTVPGADQVCPQPLANQPPGTFNQSANGFRWGTVPSEKSKCNCSGFDVPITVILPPAVGLTKTADAASVNAGSQIGFAVTLNNTGAGPATTVAINDPLPAGTGVSWSLAAPSTGWSVTGTAPTQSLVYSAGSLAAGATTSAHVISSTTSASCTTYPNTATVTLGNGTAPPPAAASITVACPTLGITKLPATQTVSAGDPFSWTVTLTNNGPGVATASKINDTLPVLTGVSYVVDPTKSAASCSITGGVLSCGPVDLAASGTLVAVINATTSAGTSCSATGITNTATGLATGLSKVQASATTILNCPKIGITKTPATQTVSAGTPFSWTVTLTNSGDGTAVGATISDPLPVLTGVSYAVDLAKSAATCSISNAGTLTCGPVNLAKNGTLVAVINATTSAGTSCSATGITNTATGSATGVSSVQAGATSILNCPKLDITKTPATQTVSAGTPFSWTVTLTNSGAGTAFGAAINDPLPPLTGVSYSVDKTKSAASCAIGSTATLTCGPVDLAAGGTLVAVINATTSAGTSCSATGITNTATGSATGVSSVQAGATTIINCPKLDITKTPLTQTVSSGTPFSWTVTLTNTGTGTAVGSTISDPLPQLTGVSYKLGAGSDATCSIDAAGTQLSCTAKDLSAGSSTVAIVNATTSAGSSCSATGITNTATGSATGLSSVKASATTIINCPKLEISKTPTTQTVGAGSPFSWVVTLKNTGAGTAIGATISDPLPAVTGVSYTLGSSSPAAANCAIDVNNKLTCGPLDLATNGTITATINATSTGLSCSLTGFTNTATGSATGVSDVKATATTTLNCPNLSVVKTPDKLGDPGYTVTVPGTAAFTITVSNSGVAGTGTATGVVLTDTLPAGVTWSADNALCPAMGTVTTPAPPVGDGLSHQRLICNIGTLAAGGTFTVHVSAPVTSSILQQPPSPSGSPIAIDGTLTASHDWATLSSAVFSCTANPIILGCDLDKPTGTSDDSFGQGTKEDAPVPSVVSGSIPNNKSDLQRFYVATERFVTTNFLYLAWERVQAPTGTTNMDFELNQSRTLSSNGVTPVRTAGDILIKYDLSKGGTQPTLGFLRWLTSGVASTVCEASSSLPCWGKATPLLNGATAAINIGAVTDPILAPGQAGPRPLDALTFGEASIDLQTTGIFQAGACVSFGKAYLKSRSSDAFTSEIKDFIKPVPISVTNCAPVTLDNLAWVSASNITKPLSDPGQIQVTEP